MFKVNTDGNVKEYEEEEFIKKFGMESKRDLFKVPFTDHILNIDNKTVVVTVEED